MYKHVKGEAFITSFQPAQGTIVVDVNCQGLMLYPHQERFMRMFPKSYKTYMELLLSNGVLAGDTIWMTEDNFVICLIVTRDRIVGKNKDEYFEIEEYTAQAIQNLVDQNQDGSLLCSIVNRNHHSTFIKAVQELGKQLDWYIYGS